MSEHFDIDSEIIARAAECRKDHACLRGTADELCKLKALSLDKFCCLKKVCDTECPYCTALDTQAFCGCPVRIGIYKKYGL